jgi:hypothetical protein
MKGRHQKPALMLALLDIQDRLEKGTALDPAMRATLIEIIEAITDDQDPREKYWSTARGAPNKNWDARHGALLEIEQHIAAKGKQPIGQQADAMIEAVAGRWGLSFDAVERDYKAVLKLMALT